MNRIIDVFPAHQQEQVRTMLSFTLEAVFSQALVPTARGEGRVLASEIMIATPAVRALIRDDKAHQIYSHIQTGGQHGMQTMTQSLANLVRAGACRLAEAERLVPDPNELQSALNAA
jgi:twitching motility protein PilT